MSAVVKTAAEPVSVGECSRHVIASLVIASPRNDHVLVGVLAPPIAVEWLDWTSGPPRGRDDRPVRALVHEDEVR
ncbi:hypothetical protein DW322_14775 [Rhodococcus rhodnii]|uniref:Uncharacterized protein n=2 Tax=Rhodococcus rhodnii TaxID=38312 RepID=R7WT59_9NOCA|nr:hypothetical protein Rrhod_0264 [Rhodococcus rhodnii LMG 5362]TXG91246.1 hypothetical protein DW322_14775 [Rhodococcus rhodnii]